MSPSFLQPVPIFLLSAGFLLTPCALRAGDDPAANPAVVAKADADRKAVRAALARVQREIGGRAPAELEREICRDAATVHDYLGYLGNPRIPELEKALWSDVRIAVEYADHVLQSPWPEAEPTIARDPFASAIYATLVLCRPWPEAEPVIFANGHATAWYHEKFPYRVTPEARKRMESDPWGAANHAKAEARRIPELEPVILKNASASSYYAEAVIKAPWPEAEAARAANPATSEKWSVRIYDEKWILAEAAEVSDRDTDTYYEKYRLWLEAKAKAPQGAALALARILVEAPEPDFRHFDSMLLTDPDARAILAKRPGLRIQVFINTLDSLPADWKISDDLREEINSEATSAVILAKKYAKPAPKATEAIIARHGRAAADYAREILKRPWPEAEPAIMRYPEGAVKYASDVLKKPWPEAEPLIALTPEWALPYADTVLHARWPRCETAMARSRHASDYAEKFRKERWPEAEPAIARDIGASNYAAQFKLADWPDACRVAILTGAWPENLMEKLAPGRRPELEKFILDTRRENGVASYASRLLLKRWPEGEALILEKRDAKAAVDYAAGVIKAPWTEAEAFILNSPSAARYAADVLRKPIPASEAEILKDPEAAMQYVMEARRIRWPEAEAVLARITDHRLVDYCSYVAKCRVPVAEKALLEKGDTSVLVKYADRVIHGRWPEAEAKLILNAHAASSYAEEVLRRRWPEAEHVIKRDVNAACHYATRVLKSRWAEMEAEILNDPSAGYNYAASLFHERSPVLEATLLKSGTPIYAAMYAKNIIGGPWPEAEALISRDLHSAFEYAQLTGRRCPAIEPELLKHAASALEYAELVLKARWPEAEPLIMEKGRPVEYAQKVIKGRFPEAEPAIAKDARESLTYAKEILRGRFPAAEPVIAKDADTAFTYAKEVLHGRFEAAEPAISAKASCAVEYAKMFLPGRFVAAEPVIAADSDAAAEYVASVIKGPWPEGEAAIANDRHHAVDYALKVLKRRWPEAEAFILAEGSDPYDAKDSYINSFPELAAKHKKLTPDAAYWRAMEKKVRDPEAEAVLLESPEYALAYARYLIKGRWPEAEGMLAKAPEQAVAYAADIIKGRWPEAEPSILKSPHLACRYAEQVIKGRWPEAEVAFAKSPYPAALYAEHVIKGRWPEAEAVIAPHPDTALFYARCVLKRRWPEGEEAIRRDARMALIYASEVLNARWPEAEETLLNNADEATWYAVLVLGDRWPEFEERMKKSGPFLPYVMRVIRKRMPELEPELLSRHDADEYVKAFIHEHDDAVEKLFWEKLRAPKNTYRHAVIPALAAYIKHARRTPWPEIEKLIGETDFETMNQFVGYFPGPRRPAYETHLREQLKRGLFYGAIPGALISYVGGLNAGEVLPVDLEASLYDILLARNHHEWPGRYREKNPDPVFEEKLLGALAKLRTPNKPEHDPFKHDEYEGLLFFGASYASRIRGTRWPGLEKFLSEYPWYALEYRKHHADLRIWPDLETALRKCGEKSWLDDYLNTTDPAKFVSPDAPVENDAKLSREEARILFKDPSRAFRCARDVIRGRWPEFERELMTKIPRQVPTNSGGLYGGPFDDKYRDEKGRETSESVASLYIREIVRGPLPEYESYFAQFEQSILEYSRATRREFPAGEPQLRGAGKSDYRRRGSTIQSYLNGLLDDPGATVDRNRLFHGPNGARFRREALRAESISSYGNDEPGKDMLRDALESRE